MTEVRTASPTRPTRYIPVAIGAVVALFGVLVGGYFFWGWLNRQSEAQQQIYHHSVREITLDTSSADLTFESGKSDEVVVNRQLSWTYGKPNIQETWDGDVLRISSN